MSFTGRTRTGTEGDKNTPKPGHGHNPAKTTTDMHKLDIYAKYQVNQVETEEGVR